MLWLCKEGLGNFHTQRLGLHFTDCFGFSNVKECGKHKLSLIVTEHVPGAREVMDDVSGQGDPVTNKHLEAFWSVFSVK